MFSIPVRVGYRAISWGAMPILFRSGFEDEKRISPLSGLSSPARIRSSVDFPAPLGPISPVIDPAGNSIDASVRAQHES